MKIISKGILPQNQVYHGTCNYCRAIVEVAGKEVSVRNLGDRYSGEIIEHSVKCPTEGCDCQIILLEGKAKT